MASVVGAGGPWPRGPTVDFAFAAIDLIRREEPELFDDELAARVTTMLEDVAEHTNFFERTVSAYQVGVEGDVAFDEQF